MERDKKSYSWAGLHGALAVLFVAVLLCPKEAFSQTRYSGYSRVWSSRANIAGKRVRGRRLPPLVETSDSYAEEEASPQVEDLPAKTAPQSYSRASLHYGWNPSDEKEKDTQVKAQSEKPQNVRVELFLAPQTDAALRKIAVEKGVSYNQALYRFLQIGLTVHNERLFCAKPPRYSAASR